MIKWWYVITPRCLPQDGDSVLYKRNKKSFIGYEIIVIPEGEGGQNFNYWKGAIGFIPKGDI